MITQSGDESGHPFRIYTKGKIDYPRQGSNLRPFAPEANALIH